MRIAKSYHEQTSPGHVGCRRHGGHSNGNTAKRAGPRWTGFHRPRWHRPLVPTGPLPRYSVSISLPNWRTVIRCDSDRAADCHGVGWARTCNLTFLRLGMPMVLDLGCSERQLIAGGYRHRQHTVPCPLELGKPGQAGPLFGRTWLDFRFSIELETPISPRWLSLRNGQPPPSPGSDPSQ
jgi:hypothetical protein